MEKLLNSNVNMLLALLTIVLGTIAGGLAGTIFARDIVYDYRLSVDPGTGEHIALQYGVWPELANTDFFQKVRDGFVAEGASFVEANLSAMTMNVYRDGIISATVPIKSKGREGSWWETPSGLYRAQAKEDTHFSSFGKVYMPYSVPFQGNFFIHGWPYYPDGTPVAEGYSGGCIRLEDIHAKEVYDLMEVGMPILVFEEPHPDAEFTYDLKAPDVHAASYLVADLENNFVLVAGNTAKASETTSVTTIMTALVASEYQNIEKMVPVRSELLAGNTTRSRLVAGRSYSLYDLFFPLLLEGSADAQRVLASYFGERRFTELLQTKARALGMEHTTFSSSNTQGASAVTTPEDIFLLLKYLVSNRPFILAMSANKTDTRTYGQPSFGHISSIHPLRTETGFVGGAADRGTHELAQAEETTAAVALVFASSSAQVRQGTQDLITVLDMGFGGEERTVAFIVLDSRDPARDTRSLIHFTSQLFQ